MKILPNNINRVAEGSSRTREYDKSIPLISIVMVVYNGAEFIEEALNSVFEQSYKNIEFIVIDGASKDNTVNILRRYDDKIDYWVSEPDSGQSDAFNKGFSVCSGDLVTWLNSDELLVPNCIEKVANRVKEDKNIQWLSGDIIMTDHEKNIIRCRSGEGATRLLSKFGFLNVYGPSTFFSLDIFNAVGQMNNNLHYTMDTDLWWRFNQYGVKLHRLGSYVYIYRLHENSKTARYIVRKEARNPEQTQENSELCKKYMSCDKKFQRFFGKILLAIIRGFSFKYINSLIHSKQYKDIKVETFINEKLIY